MKENESKLKNVAALNNQYTKEQYAEFQKQQKQLVFRRRRLAVVFMIAFVIFSLAGIQLFNDYNHLIAVEKEKKEVVSESADADGKVKYLKREVDLLKDDEYVAKLARSYYLLSKEGEQVFIVPGFNKPVDASGENKQELEKKQSDASSADPSAKKAE